MASFNTERIVCAAHTGIRCFKFFWGLLVWLCQLLINIRVIVAECLFIYILGLPAYQEVKQVKIDYPLKLGKEEREHFIALTLSMKASI